MAVVQIFAEAVLRLPLRHVTKKMNFSKDFSTTPTPIPHKNCKNFMLKTCKCLILSVLDASIKTHLRINI